MALLKFGVFEFDPDSGALWRKGRPVHLQRQPALMLAALLANPGDIVSREALQQAIWGADTHVDFERGLNFCAAQIRTALRDSASQPQYVETVPRRGYRFIAPLHPSETPRPSVAGSDDKAVYGLSGRAALFVMVLIGVVGGAVWFVARPASAAPPPIAVVPFENETGAPEVAQTAKDLSDATVARLASADRLSRVRVIGNAAALRFTFVPRDLQRMGASVGAEFIVLGQLKSDDRGLRVVAHLIRVSDQTHVWANTFDREKLDLSGQSEIAEAIASAVVAHVAKVD